MTRTLVIAPQWIGDAVMSEPLLARLAERGEVLTVAAVPWVAPVYDAMPQVQEVVALPFAHGRLDLRERWRLGRAWRGRFQSAYVLPNSLKSALLPAFAKVPVRIGYQGEARVMLLNRRLPNPSGHPPMVAFYAALADAAAPATRPVPARPEAAVRPRLHLPSDRITAVCAAQGVLQGRYWAFAPGAEYGPAKRWPPAHYAELARSLHARQGWPVLLLGSAKEAALCEEIAALAPGACRVMAGVVSLLDAFALIAGAAGMASNDSGLMHVAAAFGVAQVAVFGSTSPEHTPPLNPHARVLWLKEELALACAPCFERTCRYGHTRCLTGVTARRAEEALDAALAGHLPPVDLPARSGIV